MYGISFNIEGHPNIDITSGWRPSSYLGKMTFTVNYLSAPSITRDFDVPDGTELVVIPSGPSTDSKAEGGITSVYILGSNVSGSVVTISQIFWSGYASSSFNGRQVDFLVFSVLKPDSLVSGYGVFFTGCGINAAITEGLKSQVLLYKNKISATSATSINVNTGIAVSAIPPIAFVSDSEFNCFDSYVYSQNGTYWVSIKRTSGYWSEDGKVLDLPPSVADVRIAVFGEFDGLENDMGMSIYAEDGTAIYSTSRAPLMPRRFLTNPSPYVNTYAPFPNNKFFDNAGDQLTSEEMQRKPMIMSRKMGVGKVRFRVVPASTWIKDDGMYTAGVNGASGQVISGGAESGWWGMDSSYFGLPFIYGDDYFDDY
ncbi:hypothetical protein ACUT0J_001770 [Vibrio vulnificus]